ncbi:MAG: PAAR domain-containing protein [Pseudomonadota bacterium]
MGFPAARVTDMHVCPMVTPGVPPVPHVGGPIIPPTSPNVMTVQMPQARLGDKATCVGPPDTLVVCSTTVLVNSMPAARLMDSFMHGGKVLVGAPTVLIG